MNTVRSLIFFAALVGLVGASGSAWSKPMSPLTVSINSLETPVAGKIFPFSVTLQSRTDFERVEVNLDLPPGLALLSGELKTLIPMQIGKPVTLEFSAQLPSTLTGAILARARVGAAQEVMFQVSSRYELSSARRKAQAHIAPTNSVPFQRKLRDGQPIREYTLP